MRYYFISHLWEWVRHWPYLVQIRDWLHYPLGVTQTAVASVQFDKESMNNVIAILKNIRPEFDFAGVDDFFARGMLDSFDLTVLVSALEEQFGVSIDGADIVPENLRNVKAIAALLGKYGVAG